MTRAFSVTVRQPDGQPVPGAAVCVNDRCGRTAENGRVRLEDIPADWHDVQLGVEADGFTLWSQRLTNLPEGNVDWEDVYLQPLVVVPVGLRIEGDHFMRGDQKWYWKGSTDFRIPERLQAGVDMRPIVQDRKDAGANLLRVLSMKSPNTGWLFAPNSTGHDEAMKATYDLLGDMGMYGEVTIFADTKKLMPNLNEQREYYARQCAILRDYPHMMLELVNEDKHPTQAINAQAFEPPSGILASHGSGLSDVQPVKPLWQFATYHARRSGSIGKILSNYSPYVFQDTFPTPVPYIPEETLQPEKYGYDTRVAECMGEHARCGAGGTFHGNWWNEPRLFDGGERACAFMFYQALSE